MKKDFKNWHSIKEKINYDKVNFRFREKDVFFMYLGANVGFEQDGGEDYSRSRYRDGVVSKNDFFKLQEKFLNLVVTPLEKPKGAHKSDL